MSTSLSAIAANPDVLPPLRNPPVLEGTEDLTNLSYLNEPAGEPSLFSPPRFCKVVELPRKRQVTDAVPSSPRRQSCTRSCTATLSGPSTPTRASSSSPSIRSLPSRESTITLSFRRTPLAARANSNRTCLRSPKRRTGAWSATEPAAERTEEATRPSSSRESRAQARRSAPSTSCAISPRSTTPTSPERKR